MIEAIEGGLDLRVRLLPVDRQLSDCTIRRGGCSGGPRAARPAAAHTPLSSRISHWRFSRLRLEMAFADQGSLVAGPPGGVDEGHGVARQRDAVVAAPVHRRHAARHKLARFGMQTGVAT